MKPKKHHYLLTILLPVQIAIILFLDTDNQWIENYYATGIYPIISGFFRIILSWIPFSVGDILLGFGLLVMIRFFYISVKTFRRTWQLRLLQITSFLSVLYGSFYLLWGLNYYRQPLAKNLGFEQRQYSNQELIMLSEFLVDELNTLQEKIAGSDSLLIINPYDQKTMYSMARKGYDNLATEYPQFRYQFGHAKSSLMSLIQSYNGTSGYLNPLTGEAQVNSKIPKTGYPTTICHEMSHQIGIAAENEANFVGFLGALYNDDPYFQYAAYRMATRYAIFELYKRDRETYKILYRKINKGIIEDFNESAAFWDRYKNPFEPLVKKGYNAYLKANKQTKGIESYNYVVDLLISYYLEKGLKTKSI